MFAKALGFISSLVGSLSVIGPVLAAFGVTIPPVAIAVAPLAVAMMGKAEEALGDGTGPLKKQAVTEGLVAFSSAMQKASTGGQAATWAAITPEVVSGLIDGVAGIANNIAKSAGSAPVFDSTVFDATKAGGTI